MIPRWVAADLRKHRPTRYLNTWQAMTMRWIWLVPS